MPESGDDRPYAIIQKRRVVRNPDRHLIWQEKVEYLINKRFPPRGAEIRGAYKENIPEIVKFVDEIESRLREEYLNYSNFLNSLSFDQITELYRVEWGNANIIIELTKEEHEKSLSFNKPEAEANFDHFTRMASWTIDEASALLVGKDPRQVTELEFRRNPGTACGERYVQIRDLLLNAASAGDLKEPFSPRDILSWAKRIELEIPFDLERLINWRHSHTFDWRKRCNERELQLAQVEARQREADAKIDGLEKELEALRDAQSSLSRNQNLKSVETREKRTFQKMILGMAICKFQFAPDRRNPAANLIMEAVDSISLTLNDDTIREKLQEAVYDLDFTRHN